MDVAGDSSWLTAIITTVARQLAAAACSLYTNVIRPQRIFFFYDLVDIAEFALHVWDNQVIEFVWFSSSQTSVYTENMGINFVTSWHMIDVSYFWVISG